MERRGAKLRVRPGTPEVLKLSKRMTMLFRDRLEEQLRPLHLTAAQLQLLGMLLREPCSSGAQLARYCQVRPQTMHTLLAAAERRGWVERTPHAENGHTLLASLTPRGRQLFARGKTVALRVQRQMLRTLSPAAIAQLEATLAELIDNLESAPAHPASTRRPG